MNYRLIDIICPACATSVIDIRLEQGVYPVCTCGTTMERLWAGKGSAGVVGDDIPGGLEVKHGLCNEDGSPRKYYSKTEMAREAKKRGWVSHVTHQTPRGTDKSKHTTRWT